MMTAYDLRYADSFGVGYRIFVDEQGHANRVELLPSEEFPVRARLLWDTRAPHAPDPDIRAAIAQAEKLHETDHRTSPVT